LLNEINRNEFFYYIFYLSVFHAANWLDISTMYSLYCDCKFNNKSSEFNWTCTIPVSNYFKSLPIIFVIDKIEKTITRYINVDDNRIPDILKQMSITILNSQVLTSLDDELNIHLGPYFVPEEHSKIIFYDDLNRSIENLNLSYHSRNEPNDENTMQQSLISKLVDWISSKLPNYSNPKHIVDLTDDKAVNVIFHNWYGRFAMRKLLFSDLEIKRVTENNVIRKIVKYDEIRKVYFLNRNETWIFIFEYKNKSSDNYSADKRDVDWIRRYLLHRFTDMVKELDEDIEHL